MTTYYTYVESPIGRLLLMSDGAALTVLHMLDERESVELPRGAVQDASARPLSDAVRQLEEYFAGGRTAFDLPLRLAGTPFQRRVWQELQAIPYGTTISYGELARRIGEPGASRAVGMANGRNPIAVIVPCHRVIGANGHLVGFGGGLGRKRTLLDLEAGSLWAVR